MSINNLDLPRNLIILATPPTPTSVPPPPQEDSEKPIKVQLSIPLTSPNLLLPPSPSSEPVSPAAPQTATLGYSSDPVSPCPQRMGGHYSSYQPNFHPYQNTLIKSEPSSHSSLQVSKSKRRIKYPRNLWNVACCIFKLSQTIRQIFWFTLTEFSVDTFSSISISIKIKSVCLSLNPYAQKTLIPPWRGVVTLFLLQKICTPLNLNGRPNQTIKGYSICPTAHSKFLQCTHFFCK